MRLKFEHEGITYPFSIYSDGVYEEQFVMIPDSEGNYLKARIDNNGEFKLDNIIPMDEVKIIFDYQES